MSLEERMRYAEMKARHTNVLRPWYKKWWGWLLILIGLAFLAYLLLASAYFYFQVQENLGTAANQSVSKAASQYLIEGPKTYHTGTSSPKVTIVEFSDFACPYCHYSSAAIKEVMAVYGDSVALVYRDLPLHENSIELSLAARCAGRQGKFWPMYYLLFDNYDSLSAATDLPPSLLSLARSLELDEESFKSCFENEDPLREIERDYNDAQTLGLVGTPTWFFNNHQLTGYLDGERMAAVIENLLAETE